MDKDAQSWLGRRESELVLVWGEPSRTEPDGHGGVVLIYEPVTGTRQRAESPEAGRVEANNAAGGVDGQLVRKFLVNRAGVIYAWDWRRP